MNINAPLVSRKLSAWFSRHARALPWRKRPTAYRVWISEVMLQQTQAATVTPYFERFVQRFPDVRALAAAPLDEVLALWSGLGYYRRARLLHACSREIVTRHGGKFPREFDAVLSLPGIGRYTAGAICSIALGQPRPVLDGNVERVLARLTALRMEVKSSRAQKRLWSLTQTLVEAAAIPAVLNQALMELGALVCTPRDPRCNRCPLRGHCAAHKAEIATSLPVRRSKTPARAVRYAALILRDDRGRLLLRRRAASQARQSLLPHGLWEPPHLNWPEGQDSPPLDKLARSAGVKIKSSGNAVHVRHNIMNWKIELVGYPARLVGPSRMKAFAGNWNWFLPEDAAKAAASSATRKLLTSV